MPKLKEYICENNLIFNILSAIGCHHIKDKGDYFQCANPDGDNCTAVIVYNNCNLKVINYTRDLGMKDFFDIFDLVQYYMELNFFQSVKYICQILELDYYKDWNEELPESLALTKMLLDMQNDEIESVKEKPLKPISENVLNYYYHYCNDLFFKDNIDYKTQKEFEIGYDDFTNCITIPIRDEIGTLVGVKGRLFKSQIKENENKYTYIEPCARNKVLYGLYKTYNYIKSNRKVYICESEKGVLQLWSYGIYNSVATGGKQVSSCQIEKLTRLCVDLIFMFDKDVNKEEIERLSFRFVEGVKIYAVIDNCNILNEKESPVDNQEKFNLLLKKCLKKIK